MRSLTELVREFQHHFERNVHEPMFCHRCRLEAWLEGAEIEVLDMRYEGVSVGWINRELLGTVKKEV